jgi:phage gp36-like protein
MPYCVAADMLAAYPTARLVELTDDEASGSVSEVRINQALSDAQGLVDAYLGRRYQVPLATPPVAIKRLVLDLAYCGLLERRDVLPEEWKERRKAVQATLDAIATGKLSVGVDPPPSDSAMALGAEVTAEDRVFTRATMKDVL